MSIFELLNGHSVFVLLCAVAGMGFFQRYLKKEWREKWMFSYWEIASGTIMMVLSICSLAGNTYNPFIYFRF